MGGHYKECDIFVDIAWLLYPYLPNITCRAALVGSRSPHNVNITVSVEPVHKQFVNAYKRVTVRHTFSCTHLLIIHILMYASIHVFTNS